MVWYCGIGEDGGDCGLSHASRVLGDFLLVKSWDCTNFDVYFSYKVLMHAFH